MAVDVRDVRAEDLRASTRCSTWQPSPTTPSATSTRAAPTTSTTGSGWPGWPSRPAWPGSCSPPAAACTGPPTTTGSSTSRPPSTRSPPTASPRSWPSGTSRPRRRRLQPHLPAQRHRLRGVAAAARGRGGQQPGRHRLRHRGGAPDERRTPWRPLVHVQDISAAFQALLEAPASWSTTRPSTSAGPRRTTASARSPRWSARWCRAARSPSPKAPGPTCATTGWTAPSWPGCPGWSPLDRPPGRRGALPGVQGARPGGRRPDRRPPAIAQIRQLMDRDQVDADLRWRR